MQILKLIVVQLAISFGFIFENLTLLLALKFYQLFIELADVCWVKTLENFCELSFIEVFTNAFDELYTLYVLVEQCKTFFLLVLFPELFTHRVLAKLCYISLTQYLSEFVNLSFKLLDKFERLQVPNRLLLTRISYRFEALKEQVSLEPLNLNA